MADFVKHVTEVVASGIPKHCGATAEKKKHADDGVAAGRKFVEAYVDFSHYVEGLHLDVTGPVEDGKETQGGAPTNTETYMLRE